MYPIGIHEVKHPNNEPKYFSFSSRIYEIDELEILIDQEEKHDYLFDISRWNGTDDLSGHLAPFLNMVELYGIELKANKRQKGKIDMLFGCSVIVVPTEDGNYSITQRTPGNREERLLSLEEAFAE